MTSATDGNSVGELVRAILIGIALIAAGVLILRCPYRLAKIMGTARRNAIRIKPKPDEPSESEGDIELFWYYPEGSEAAKLFNSVLAVVLVFFGAVLFVGVPAYLLLHG